MRSRKVAGRRAPVPDDAGRAAAGSRADVVESWSGWLADRARLDVHRQALHTARHRLALVPASHDTVRANALDVAFEVEWAAAIAAASASGVERGKRT